MYRVEPRSLQRSNFEASRSSKVSVRREFGEQMGYGRAPGFVVWGQFRVQEACCCGGAEFGGSLAQNSVGVQSISHKFPLTLQTLHSKS